MDWIDCLQTLFKTVETTRIDVDAIVNKGPCFVFNALISSDGGGEADALVYDGFGTDGKKRLDLYCVDEAMAQTPLFPPMYFRQGIYVDIGSNVEAVTIMFMQFVPRLSAIDEP